MALHELGSFKTTVVGDTIEGFYIDLVDAFAKVFWDDVTEEIVVYRYNNLSDWTNNANGYVITEASIYPDNAIDVGEKSTYKFCQAGDLVEFSQFKGFPIFVKQITASHFSCLQVVCDLAFQGAPIIDPAPSESEAGRVRVTATSSNGNIEYGLSTFSFGQGSPVGDFNLLPGAYTVISKDEAGCTASVQITIPIGEAQDLHQLKYFSSYYNELGEQTRIEILEKNYEGDPIELGVDEESDLGTGPFMVSWGKSGDLKQEPIKPSEAKINLISQTDYRFLEFYTNETQYYKIKVKRDENGSLLWWGYVVPEFYGEPYTQPPYYVNLICNDGLGDLQNIPFALVDSLYNQTSNYTGRMTHLQVVVEILKKIGNELPIYTAINMVEEGMGYEDVPNILKYTFETDFDEIFPNDLEEGVKYIFKVKDNLNIGIYYETELIYNGAPAATGLVNGDFSDNLNGWSQSQNGFASETFTWIGTTNAFWDKGALIDTSSPKSNYLFQTFNFTEGVEYTLNVSAYRYQWALTRAKIRLKFTNCDSGQMVGFKLCLDGVTGVMKYFTATFSITSATLFQASGTDTQDVAKFIDALYLNSGFSTYYSATQFGDEIEITAINYGDQYNFGTVEIEPFRITLVSQVNNNVDSRYRIKVFIGVHNSGQEVYDSGLLDYSAAQDIEISQLFTPDVDYGFLYIWLEFSMTDGAYGQFVLDVVSIEAAPSSSGEATFEYTPTISHEDISIDILGGADTIVEIYESIQDAFNQIYVNTDNYTAEGGMSCLQVLKEQLKIYGARMYQADGAWHIVRFDQQNDEYLRNKYSPEGVFIESEYFNPIFNITSPSASVENIWVFNDMMLEMKPGYRNQTIVQDLGYVENLIVGGDFPISEFTVYGLKSFTFGSAQGLPPKFFEPVNIENDNYALSYKNSFTPNYDIYKAKKVLEDIVTFISYSSKSGFPGVGALKTVYIDTSKDEFWLWSGSNYTQSLYESERLPPGIGEDDFVLVDSLDPEITGYYQVKGSESWIRLNAHYYIGPSAGRFILVGGVYYKIARTPKPDGDSSPYEMYVSVAAESEVTFTKGERYFIKNNPIYLEFDEGDQLLIRVNKKYTQPSKKGVKVYLGLEIRLGDYYLYDDFTFKNFYNHIEIDLSDEKGFSIIEIVAKLTEGLAGDFSIYAWFYCHGIVDFINVDVITGETIDPQFSLPNLQFDYIYATYLPQGIYPPTERTQLMNNSKKFYEIPSDIEVLHGDAPEILNKDKVYSYYLTRSDQTLTEKWHRKGFYESKNLLKLLLEIVLSNNLNNNELITGNIRKLLSLNDVMFDPNNPGRLFMMNFLEWNEMKHTSQAEVVEVKGLPEDETAAFSYGFSHGFKS